MAWAATNGQRVVCVTATRGEAGSQDELRWPSHQLGQVRTKEMADALNCYGITEHHWLDYPDGGCAQLDEAEPVGRIAELIEQIRPDTVLTFGSEGITGHTDHQAVCRWTHQALKQTGHGAIVLHPVIAEEQFKSHYKIVDEKINMFFAIDEPPTKPAKDCDVCIDLPEDILHRKHEAISKMPSQTAVMLDAFDKEFLEGMLSTECLVRCRA